MGIVKSCLTKDCLSLGLSPTWLNMACHWACEIQPSCLYIMKYVIRSWLPVPMDCHCAYKVQQFLGKQHLHPSLGRWQWEVSGLASHRSHIPPHPARQPASGKWISRALSKVLRTGLMFSSDQPAENHFILTSSEKPLFFQIHMIMNNSTGRNHFAIGCGKAKAARTEGRRPLWFNWITPGR